MTHGLEGHLESLGAEERFAYLGELFVADIANAVDSRIEGLLQAEITEVGDENFLCAPAFRGLGDEVADRARAGDEDIFAFQARHAVRGVGGHGGGFDERPLLKSEVVGECHDSLFRCDEDVLCAARGLEATNLERVADIVVAAFAGNVVPGAVNAGKIN